MLMGDKCVVRVGPQNVTRTEHWQTENKIKTLFSQAGAVDAKCGLFFLFHNTLLLCLGRECVDS